MVASHATRWIPSSKANPCPVCGRTKDGDCRISGDGQEVICHHPKDLKPGSAENGWAFTGNSSDGRAGHFVIDKPRETAQPDLRPKVVPMRRRPNPAPINGPITLATIEPVQPKGSPWAYSPTQRTKRVNLPGGKKEFYPHHLNGKTWVAKQGPNPWPVFGVVAPGWVLELEGEKCCEIALSAGVSAISQPGHAHKVEQIIERYRDLQAAGVTGIVYLPDNDDEGERRAHQAVEAAAEVQLPLLVLRATDVWADLPVGGSIDDAPGTAAERVSAITAAITARSQSLLRQREKDREPTLAERITQGIEALLQATLANDQSEIDASLSELYRLGVSRERAQERVLMLWAEQHGYDLSPGGGKPVARGRVFGKAKESAGLRQQLPGFLLDRDLHLLVATASGGKTLAAAELATVMSARDRGFLDHEAPRSDGTDDTRNTVLVIASDGEGSAYAMWETYLQDICADERGASIEIWAQDDETGEQAWNVSLPNLDRLVKRLEEADIGLVVIDTANSVMRGAGINTGVGPVETYLRLLKQIVCRHCALLITHHTSRKASPDLKGIGGHPAFQEVPSVVHMIEPKQQADGTMLRLWHVLKLRGSNYRRFAYELREGRLLVTEGHLFQSCDEQVLVALHTQLLMKAGTAPGELIRLTKRPPQSVYNALDRLRGAKLVRRRGNGYRLTPSGEAAVKALRI